jgi:SAM-dependent methyltransferase
MFMTLAVGHTFDVVVCLFSSIGYVKTVESLRRTIASMARHLRPGGVVFVEPWYSPSSYWVGHIGLTTWVDEPELKIVWMYTQKVEDRVSVDDVNYLVGMPEGVQHFVERHEMGLFTHEEYLSAFREAGLEVHYLTEGLWGRGMYVGVSDTLGTE